ncbi:MAG: ESPR domain-containing protein, partial [Megasphaera elsdenii]|nr:ESPR domain-containing protein [Megasphaera elsdenii]
MNRIFKVIWSKTKNCYVVASELAKGTSKSTSTGRMAKRAVLAAVAALLISPLGAGYVSAADDYVTVKDVSGTEQTVYTKDGVDIQLGEYAKNTTVSKNTSDISDLKTADEQLQTNIDNEAAAREAADTKLDSRTSAVETKTASLTRVADANSTSINESMTYKGNQYSATLQVNGSGAQIGVVNNEAAGLANDGGTAYTEYRARTGAIVSKATNDISSTSSNGQIIDTAGDTAGEYSQVATAKSTGTTFTYNDGTSSSSTTIKGNAISTGS